MFIAALLTIAKTLKQSKCPLRDEQVKMFYIYTHTHIHTHTHIYIYIYVYLIMGFPGISDGQESACNGG